MIRLRWAPTPLLLFMLLISLGIRISPGWAQSAPASPVSPSAVPGRLAVPAQPSVSTIQKPDAFTPHVPPRAIAYQRSHRLVGLGALAWSLLGLFMLAWSGLSARLRTAVVRAARLAASEANAPPFRVLALYYVLFSALLWLWQLPFGLAGLALEQRYGFARQTMGGTLRDELLGLVLSLQVIPVVWGGYWLIARSPRRWWLWLWAALVPLLLFQMVVRPVLIAPLYNRFTPLPAGPLRDQILALAGRAGISGGRVFVEDTSRRTAHVNAYVTGLGSSARIVLNDTALQTLPEDQILAMVGHEMGHYVEGHIWVMLAGSIGGAGLFLWLASRLLPWADRHVRGRWGLRGIRDLAALPLVMGGLSLFLLAQAPIENAESRTLERRADAFGLRVTGLPAATARLFVGFAERDYSDPDPPALLHFWFGSHPTLKERIASALAHHPPSAKNRLHHPPL